jgi:hypothetical protein
MQALSGRVSRRVWVRLMQHREPFGGIERLRLLTWNDLGFEDGGHVRVVPFHSVKDVVVPMCAGESLSWSKRRRGP